MEIEEVIKRLTPDKNCLRKTVRAEDLRFIIDFASSQRECQHEASMHLVCMKCGKLVDDKYKSEVCPSCSGHGGSKITEGEECEVCNGTGKTK